MQLLGFVVVNFPTLLTLVVSTFNYGVFCNNEEAIANVSSTSERGYNNILRGTIEEMPLMLRNCSLVPKFKNDKELINELIGNGMTQIKVRVEIVGDKGPFKDAYTGNIFRPYNWIMITSLTGRSMLMLKEYFVEMSIQTFGQSVTAADLTVIQEPSDCIKDATPYQLENHLRLSFLRNFESDGNTLPDNVEICNRRVQEMGAEGRVVYVCCGHNSSHELDCSEVHKSTLIIVLFKFISVLKWLAILYCPLFIPYSVYKARSIFYKYIFEADINNGPGQNNETDSDNNLDLNIKKVFELNESDKRKFFKMAKLHEFTHLDKFSEYIKKFVTEYDTTYTLHIKKVILSVKSSRLIAKGKAPVSVLSFLRNFFARCKMRHVIRSADECCGEPICRSCTTWYHCLKVPMTMMMWVIYALPLIIRLVCYVCYERPFVKDQMVLMEGRNLTLEVEYTEIMEYFLSYILSSNVCYLIIIIYAPVPIEWLMYKLCFSNALKRKIKFTFRKSIRDMRFTKKSKICSLYIGKSLDVFRKFGIFGLPIFPFYLSLLCILLAIEVIPVLSFSGRLFKNLNPKDEIQTFVNKGVRVFHAISSIIIIFTLFLIMILVMECISFYVECIIYALVGFILNPYTSLRYVSMIVLVAVYGHECFSGVHNRYVSYNNAINSHMQDLIGEQLKEVASQPEEEQENTAFRVPGKTTRHRDRKTINRKEERITLFPLDFEQGRREKPAIDKNRMILELGTEGYLKWRATRLVLFLDKSNLLYIPKSFLFRMANLPHYLCPGPVHLLYLKAAFDFSVIIIFLIFVFIVIIAFGQAQDISSGGQTIAALGSGLLPLFLRRFLFRSHGNTNIDKSDIRWRYMFENAVKMYSERWNFEDVLVSAIESTESNNTAAENSEEKRTESEIV